MAKIIQVDGTTQEVVIATEKDIEIVLGGYAEPIPLGLPTDPTIPNTMWVDSERELKKLLLNEVATQLLEEGTTPPTGTFTGTYVTKSENGVDMVTTETVKLSKFPPIKGIVVITDFNKDGI